MTRLATHCMLALLCAGALTGAPARSQDFTDASIQTQQLGAGLYVLFGVGGNILASVGDSGVLIVDSQFTQMAPLVRDAIAELGGDGVEFIVNTHWHFDHSDGNKVFGPDGARIVAHDNSRRMLLQDNVIDLVGRTIEQPRYERRALPALSFGESMSLHFNGERIDLLHFGSAHTMGDSAVVFRDSDVVHMGDVFNNAGYPFIDAGNGGSLNGIIEFSSAVLAQLPRTAIVVPGHGPVSDYDGLASYIAMLSEIRDRLSALMSSGATLEQVIAARITAEWDAERGDPTQLLNRAFQSLSK